MELFDIVVVEKGMGIPQSKVWDFFSLFIFPSNTKMSNVKNSCIKIVYPSNDEYDGKIQDFLVVFIC